MSVDSHFWDKVNRIDCTCWEWLGARMGGHRKVGLYGAAHRRIGRGKFRMEYAHRLSWEFANGPIPPGAEIDHTCHNKLCVRPDHLRLVPSGFNGLQGIGIAAARRATRKRCGAGHVYADVGFRLWRGKRYCRACRRIHWDRYIARKKAGLVGAEKLYPRRAEDLGGYQ